MINPTRGYTYGEILKEETMTESGIVIARTVKEIPRRARVIAVGKPIINKKGKEIKPPAQVGDLVHFKRSFGIPYEEEGKKYIFLKNEEITAREVVE